MRVNDLIDIILEYQQTRDVVRFSIDNEKKGYYLSGKYRTIIKAELLDMASITVNNPKNATQVQIFENVGKQNIKGLTNEVKEGYWVYLFICSADYWDLAWYPTLEEAEKAFEKEKVEYFIVEKVLFHTEQGIIKVVN